jgi:multicomponent Na+:H+ antiporter subunit E
MIHKLIILIFLVIFWYALSGETDAFFVWAGIFSCLFALFISIKLGLPRKLVHNHKIFNYLLWLLGQIITSGLYVSRLVWSRKLDISPEFVHLKNEGKTEVFYAMFANSITMTPGTVTLLIDEKRGIVHTHAITSKTAEDVKSGDMARKVDEVII